MSAFVKLPKVVAAQIYCLCFIAERSVDFAVVNTSFWHDFVSSFPPTRKRRFEDLLRELPNADYSSSPRIHKESQPHRMLLQLWALLRRCPSIFVFDESDLGFIRTSLANFQELLGSERPETARLIAIRRNLGECQRIIEKKWFNQKRWNVLRMADHFCRNPSLGEPLDFDTAVEKFIEK